MKNSTKEIVNQVKGEIGDKELLSAEESIEAGKELRKTISRKSQGNWEPAENRNNPVDILEKQGKERVQELLPVRYERMGVSAFTFYRGAALIMAEDLVKTPTTGIQTQICADAHISNFGIFASAERNLVFDINDFDETAHDPWEWDIKRLVTSIEICGRDRGFSKKEREKAVKKCVESYVEMMSEFATMSTMDVWYLHPEVEKLYEQFATSDKETKKRFDKLIKKANKKNSSRAVKKLTEVVDGEMRIISDPPLIVPLRDMLDDKIGDKNSKLSEVKIMKTIANKVLEDYCLSLSPDKKHLIEQYKVVDMARKVVGVGSVGTRVWIVVMQGKLPDDYLVLQIKEAEKSVVEQVYGKSEYKVNGQRVVEGQHAIQSASDTLLGWTHAIRTEGKNRYYYVRQLWDCKGSMDLDTMPANILVEVSKLCGATLAHAHARTGDRFKIAGYLGGGKSFVKAMKKFANDYANQNEKDYAVFMEKYGYLQQKDEKEVLKEEFIKSANDDSDTTSN